VSETSQIDLFIELQTGRVFRTHEWDSH